MDYFTRVFCRSKEKPSVKKITQILNLNGISVTTNLEKAELSSTSWTSFELVYNKGKLPIMVQLNEISNPNNLAKEEIKEFIESTRRRSIFNAKKKKLLKHLKSTNYILSNQIPTSDIDCNGYKANRELMKIFQQDYDGIIQCDGEGFYMATELIIKE